MTGPSRRWIPVIAGWSVTAVGLVTIGSAASPSVRGRLLYLERHLPLDSPVSVPGFSRVLAVVTGTLLLFLSGQLRRAKRRAWVAAVVLLSITVVLHLAKGLDVEESAVAFLLLMLLVAGHRQFRAASDPPSLLTLARVAPLFVFVVYGYGTLAIYLSRARITPHPNFWNTFASISAGLIGAHGPLHYLGRVFNRFFPDSLMALGITGVVGGLFLFFRPVVEGVRRHGPDDAARARDIVQRWGSDTLAYFALRDDKSYAFSDDGQAFLAYRYVNGLAMVSGDPIGPPEAVAELLQEFSADAKERSWAVAVLAGREDLAPVYATIGLRPYYLGDEAVIDPQTFSLEGRPIRKVRQSVHRLTKAGYKTQVISDTEADPLLLEEVERVNLAWRKGAKERGFSMALGRLGHDEDPECLLLLARDGDGRLRGFLHLVPCFGPEPGYSLDAMRREHDTPNGLTEYLICEAAAALKERGARRLSLNFAVFARLLSDDIKLSPLQRLQRWVVRRFNPYFQIQSLLHFNAKFFPSWVPRCIYYEDRQTLPRIALSYLQLESFVRLPFGPRITARPPDRILPKAP